MWEGSDEYMTVATALVGIARECASYAAGRCRFDFGESAERGGELADRREALARVLLQAALHDGIQHFGIDARHVAQRSRGSGHHQGVECHWSFGLEGTRTGD